MIDGDIAPFAAGYLGRLSEVVEHGDVEVLSRVCNMLSDSISNARRVCVVGNGGSSAISRSISFLLRNVPAHGQPFVLEIGDQQEIGYWVARVGYVEAFSEILRRRGLTAGDAAVLVSVSGTSANIQRLAEKCASKGVQTAAFTGGSGGTLATNAAILVATGIDDQQLSEDAIYVWLTVVVDAIRTGRVHVEHIRDRLKHVSERIRWTLLSQSLPIYLNGTAAAISTAMNAGRCVYISCDEGGPVGWSSEHLAHNLYWDAPAAGQVVAPVVRNVGSMSDVTAIYNDHPNPSHGRDYLLGGVRPGDVACIVASQRRALGLATAIEKMGEQGVFASLLLMGKDVEGRATASVSLAIDSEGPEDFSIAVQSIGHMLCRLVSQRLQDRLGKRESSVRDLLDRDLAPKRQLQSTHQSPSCE